MKLNKAFFVVLALLAIAGCSDFRKLQKSDDWKAKFDGAMRYYEEGDYYRAIALFEEVLPLTRGKVEGEQAQFYYAYAHYKDRQYILSAHYFKNFYETYTRSELANEAQFMYAYSLYQSSPVYSLDQTSTREAIQAFQIFINRNPESKFTVQANQIIRELQVKLETKAYHSAKLYHKIGYLKSAVVAIDNFAMDYPDSKFNAELQFLKIEATYIMAQKSIPSKQRERYKQVVAMYEEYAEDYPDSAYLVQAGKYFDDAVNKLQKLPKLL